MTESASGSYKGAEIPTCEVCFEDMSPERVRERNITAACTHEPNICRGCPEASITAQFETKRLDRLECPLCTARLEFNDMHEWATPEVFTRFDHLTRDAALNREDAMQVEKFRPCAIQGCGLGGYCDPERDSFVTCSSGRRTCLACEVEYHEGLSCEEWRAQVQAAERTQEQLEQEATLEKHLKKRSKPCPNTHCACENPEEWWM